MEAKVTINKDIAFTEEWREGQVEYEGNIYPFFLIDPKGKDEQGREYEMEVRWFYKTVPVHVRSMQAYIIELFKKQNQ